MVLNGRDFAMFGTCKVFLVGFLAVIPIQDFLYMYVPTLLFYQSCLALFIPFLIFLFISLNSCAPSGFPFDVWVLSSYCTFQDYVIRDFFFVLCLSRTWVAVSILAVLNVLTITSLSSTTSSSLWNMRRGANFLPMVALKFAATSVSFSFSRLNFSWMNRGFLILFRRGRKDFITRSWSLPTSAPGKVEFCLGWCWNGIFSLPKCSVSLVMVFPSWAVPCPPSGYLMTA